MSQLRTLILWIHNELIKRFNILPGPENITNEENKTHQHRKAQTQNKIYSSSPYEILDEPLWAASMRTLIQEL